MLLSKLTFASCAAMLVAARASAGDVLTVAASGPADFTQIQDAIAAANDGDTILVASGSYSAFTIDGKGVSVVEDAGASVTVDEGVIVRNVPVASRVVLSGLHVVPQSSPASTPLEAMLIENNAGAIRLYACQVEGRNGANATCSQLAAGPGFRALHVVSSPNVALANCALQGGNGGFMPCALFQEPGPGQRGLRVSSSTVAVYTTQILSGDSGDGGDTAVDGKAAADVLSSALFVSACMVTGGDGSSPGFGDCFPPGDGGAGLNIGFGSTVQRLGGTLVGGQGGANTIICTVEGDDGPQTTGSGSLFTFAVSPLSLDAPSIVRAGQSITITVHGDPGDRISLLESDETVFQNIPSWRGFLLVERTVPSRVRKLGVVPTSGVLTRTVHAGELPSGVESKTRYVQVYRTRGDGITLGGFVPLTVVDAAF